MTKQYENDDAGIQMSLQEGIVRPDPKSFYKSKTIWFNVLVTLFAILSQTVPELKQYMNAETYAAVMGLVNFVNTVLRLFTTKGIKGVSNVR